MIEIASHKVIAVITEFREGNAAIVREFIADMNDDEKAHLTAIAWVGRGTFAAEDHDEAVETAYAEATTPTEAYLTGMPHLAENLESGLEALGFDITELEEEYLGNGA